MAYFIKKIKRDIFTLMALMFGIVKKIDYKSLNTYILAINQTNTLENILLQTSICLKDILQYRLFAFVLQEKERLQCWIDPDMNMEALKGRIRKDFNMKSATAVCS